jgi:hypothetical protein
LIINPSINFHLGFGDYDKGKRKINDLAVSDNNDRDKILATVAMTALEFTDHYDECKIEFKGSTPARTRLYQMGIAKHYGTISKLFDISVTNAGSRWRWKIPVSGMSGDGVSGSR